ncbi:MAG: TetR/AcrR family transcriptional regulator [Bacteroidetes bacterium]|nr:TetR/AcrR family transcriptional regulator [Bacteroidota bacterium]
MSKTLETTEEKIVAKALEMFNEKGVEYVGMRELAAALGMRVSNITYYFPKKDDLVYRLSLDLNQANSKIVLDDSELTVASFLEKFQMVFRNHIQYRCLLLSFVHLMEQNPRMAERYKKTQNDRNSALRANIQTLISRGYVQPIGSQEAAFLVSAIALVARFWLSEARVSLQHLDSSAQIRHYVAMIGRLLAPYLTPTGLKQWEGMRVILEPDAS